MSSFIILLVIEILLYSFQLSLLILMICRRNTVFKGPFYSIFRTVLFADLFSFLFMAFNRKIALIPTVMSFLKTDTYFASVTSSAITFLTFMQFLGHMFLAFDRLALICFPLNHGDIFNRQWYTIILFLLPFLSICWKFSEPAVFTFGKDDTVFLGYLDKNVQEKTTLISTISLFSTTCFAALFNFLSFVKFIVVKKNSANINVNERNLLFVSFVIFIAQLLRVLYSAQKIVFPGNAEIASFFSAIFPALSDIFAWSGSISLYFLSSTTRKAYKSFYFCKSKAKTSSTNMTVF